MPYNKILSAESLRMSHESPNEEEEAEEEEVEDTTEEGKVKGGEGCKGN